ncbi:basic proline-rich protein-like [Phacochoerus africanus]|uniref:basic proline-rich protein-like n=1 Tax=Phacochoerus africanus TaxID=41426 RepID=UPI001FDA3CAA|nr:basic proline-rich protein-like [Phacochoerus africanus]
MGEETREHFERQRARKARLRATSRFPGGPPLPATAPRPGRPSFEPAEPSAGREAAACHPGPREDRRARPGPAWPGDCRGACRMGGARRPLCRPHAGTPARRHRPARERAGQAQASERRAGRRRNKSAFVERRPPEGHTQWRREPAPPPPPPGPPRRPPEPPPRRAPHTYTYILTGLLRLIEGVRGPRTAPSVGSGLQLCWRQRRLRGSRFAAVAAM